MPEVNDGASRGEWARPSRWWRAPVGIALLAWVGGLVAIMTARQYGVLGPLSELIILVFVLGGIAFVGAATLEEGYEAPVEGWLPYLAGSLREDTEDWEETGRWEWIRAVLETLLVPGLVLRAGVQSIVLVDYYSPEELSDAEFKFGLYARYLQEELPLGVEIYLGVVTAATGLALPYLFGVNLPAFPLPGQVLLLANGLVLVVDPVVGLACQLRRRTAGASSGESPEEPRNSSTDTHS